MNCAPVYNFSNIDIIRSGGQTGIYLIYKIKQFKHLICVYMESSMHKSLHTPCAYPLCVLYLLIENEQV